MVMSKQIVILFICLLVKQVGNSKEKHDYQKTLGALIQSNSSSNLINMSRTQPLIFQSKLFLW